jgi:hypothetical protein
MWPDRDPSSTAAIISSDVSGREGEAKMGDDVPVSGGQPRYRRVTHRSLAGTTSQDAIRPPDDPDGRHLYSPAGNPRSHLHVLTAYSVGTRPGEGGPSHPLPRAATSPWTGLSSNRDASQPMGESRSQERHNRERSKLRCRLRKTRIGSKGK